jgi:hypothetical protein
MNERNFGFGSNKSPKATIDEVTNEPLPDFAIPLSFDGANLQLVPNYQTLQHHNDVPSNRPLKWFNHFVKDRLFLFHSNGNGAKHASFGCFLTIVNYEHAENLYKAQASNFRCIRARRGNKLIEESNKAVNEVAALFPGNPYPSAAYYYNKRKKFADNLIKQMPRYERDWFTGEIGRNVYVVSVDKYNGSIKVVDETHADHLFTKSQADGFRFVSLKSGVLRGRIPTEHSAYQCLPIEQKKHSKIEIPGEINKEERAKRLLRLIEKKLLSPYGVNSKSHSLPGHWNNETFGNANFMGRRHRNFLAVLTEQIRDLSCDGKIDIKNYTDACYQMTDVLKNKPIGSHFLKALPYYTTVHLTSWIDRWVSVFDTLANSHFNDLAIDYSRVLDWGSISETDFSKLEAKYINAED